MGACPPHLGSVVRGCLADIEGDPETEAIILLGEIGLEGSNEGKSQRHF